jgi:outer membrane receptor protein involved in Fe transport
MVDLPFIRDRLRFSGGVRLQSSYILLDTTDDQGNPAVIRKNDLNPLPAVNLTYTPRSDMNIRGSWSKSVSYPEFRELTPALFPTTRGFRPIVGNPELVQSNITSADLRWEWFFSPGELVSAGAYWKSIDQPIEPTLIVFASYVAESWVNAQSGKVRGVEFEGRKNFGFIRPILERLSLGANVTYQYSKATLGDVAGSAVVTSGSRELVGFPPFVINALLEWEQPDAFTARLLYNTAAQSIAAVGGFNLPDLFHARRDQLDAVLIFPLQAQLGLPLTVKASVENILNDQFLTTQAGIVQEGYVRGTRFGLGVSYTY